MYLILKCKCMLIQLANAMMIGFDLMAGWSPDDRMSYISVLFHVGVL